MKAFQQSHTLLLLVALVPVTAANAQERDSSEEGSVKRQGSPESTAIIDTETFVNNSFGAYSKALAEGKFTVILFHARVDPFSRHLRAKVHDPRLAKYSEMLRFSYTDQDVDEGAKQLVEALGVVRYPTLVVLETNPDNIHVTGRIEGEVSVAQIDRVFRKAMDAPIGSSKDSGTSQGKRRSSEGATIE